MLESEMVRRAIERACHRADVELTDYSLCGDKVQFTVSCERGSKTFASMGFSSSTMERFETFCYRSVLDWTN